MADFACDKQHFHESHHNIMWQGNQRQSRNTRHHHYKTAQSQSPKQSRTHSGANTDDNIDSLTKSTNVNVSRSASASKKPFFLRLDSTGENSLGSAGEDSSSSGHSPQPEPDYIPNFQSGPGHSRSRSAHHWQNQQQVWRTKPSQPQGHRQAHQGGLLDRVRSAFVHCQNSGSGRFLVKQRTAPGPGGRELDSSLASLDLVAEKFTNMSCNMMSRDVSGGGGVYGHRNWQMDSNQSYPVPDRTQHPFLDKTFPPNQSEVPRVQYFHPYVGSVDQSKFTQNYRRTCFNYYQPWQQNQMMGRPGNRPFLQPFYQRDFVPCNQHMAWQQQQHYWCAPPSWNRWNCNRSAGNSRMMQHQCNMLSGTWSHSQGYQTGKPQHCSPKRKARNRNSSRKQTSPSAKSKVIKENSTNDDALAKEKSIPVSLPTCQEEKRTRENESITILANLASSANESKTLSEKTSDVCPDVQKPAEFGDASAINSSVTYKSSSDVKTKTENVPDVCPDSPKPTNIESLEIPSSPTTEGPPNEQSESTAQTAGNESPEKGDVNGEQAGNEGNVGFQRHSSIELILCDYESQTSTADENVKISTDSDFSDAECEMSDDTQSDLWESFNACDDPYNPLSGWKCSEKTVTDAASEQSCKFIQDTPIDSGTDEGDDLSETDSDNGESDEDNASLSHKSSSQTKQVKNHKRNLSSTPKKASVQSSLAHISSVAFVLGSSSSDESDEDDDDDWDTVDSSALQDDPLWDLLNRASDPYSPMNSWKCHSSGLCPSKRPQNVPSIDIPDGPSLLQTLQRGSVERLNVDKMQPPRVESSESTLSNDRTSSRESLSESGSFTIRTIVVHAAKDDLDCALLLPKTEESLIKRVASASCLRSAHPTQELRSRTKKVRFSPSSSFIVLVERDLLSSADNPCGEAGGTDWLECARDRMRFQARIDQTATALNSILLSAHREQVYQSRFSANEDR